MKKLLCILCAALWMAGCSDDGTASYYVDELVIDTANCLAEGSYVQGVPVGELCRVKIPYENARGGVARISAPETNGMRIDAQEVDLAAGRGEAVVRCAGIPLMLETSFLQLNVEYLGKTYLSSVEIVVLEDVDPSGVIGFEIDETPLTELVAACTVAFTVDPTMASVVESGTAPEGLRVSVVSDPATGAGTVTFTPTPAFLGGEVELTASFGAREPQVRTIRVCAFAAGEGTPEAPYAVSSAAELEKLRYGLDKAFRLDENIELGGDWQPVGTEEHPFVGSLDGNGRRITLALDAPERDYVALFAYAGTGASVENLTLDGSVRGGSYVAALAAASEVPLTADVANVSVEGDNFVAASIASGDGRDERIIEFGKVPAAVNIAMGEESESGDLGLATKGATVSFDPGETASTWSYDDATGFFTVVKGADFAAGNVSFFVSLNDRVRSTRRTIAVTSKNMYESGTGTADDPYVVADADQFDATLHAFPEAHVKLTADIELAEWTTLDSFSGSLDGDFHIVKGLTAPLVDTNSGTIMNLRFTDVNLETSASGSFGTIAKTTTGTISGVGVKGTIKDTATGNQQVGGIAGQINAGVIRNCYAHVDITAACSGVGGIAGFFNGSTAEGARVEFCTTEGSITWSHNASRMGGIVGRKNSNAGGQDHIANCLSSMVLSGTSTDTGSNMNGGIFGVSASGQADARLFIRQCVFNGRIKGAACAGGIAGMGPDIQDCMVLSDGFESGEATVQTNTSNNGSSGGIAAGAKGDIARCIVDGARLIGTNNTAGIVSVQNNGSPKVNSCVVLNSSVTAGGKAIYGSVDTKIAVSDSYYCGVIYGDGTSYETSDPNCDGTAVEKEELTQSWFESLGYDFTTVWMWDAAANAPRLRHVGCDDQVKID